MCLLRMLPEVVQTSYLCVVISCSYGGARGPPGTCHLMGAWTSDGTLSSGHVSGNLWNRLEIGVVGSAVGRLPDVQQSTQWLPAPVVARNGISDVVSTRLIGVTGGHGVLLLFVPLSVSIS
jgi:hypothetical protein